MAKCRYCDGETGDKWHGEEGCYAEGFRKGQEAMREAASGKAFNQAGEKHLGADHSYKTGYVDACSEVGRAIRALPLQEPSE